MPEGAAGNFTAQHAAYHHLQFKWACMKHPVRLRQPAAPLHLIGGKHSLYLEVNSTISFWPEQVSSLWLLGMTEKKKCSCDLLSSVVPYFVYNVALDMVVEYRRGHLDVSDEDAKACNRLYASVCLCLTSWLLSMLLPACWPIAQVWRTPSCNTIYSNIVSEFCHCFSPKSVISVQHFSSG